MARIVADLGNSRLKWGRVGEPDGHLEATLALPIDDPHARSGAMTAAWSAAWDRWGLSDEPSAWAISSVNPPVAGAFGAFLDERGVADVRWYTSAADVPVPHALEQPETAGADRAFAVSAALALRPGGGPGLVVSCGSAVVVERIAAEGTWQGGAIAPGLGLSARALHLLTAQLPLVTIAEAPPAWGSSTGPALAAGLFWGTVGAIREILARQAEGISPRPWLIWTGGDAPLLAPRIARDDEPARVIPDLVLIGLAGIAFGRDPGGPRP